MSDCAERFLEAYKKLEFFGRNTFFEDAKDNDNIIGRMVVLPELTKYRDELNYCRVVRNFLMHNPKVGGHYAVEPSNEMIALLERLTESLMTPELAVDICTPRKDMLSVNTSENLFDVLRRMRLKSFSHVPVFHKNKFLGIFSESSVTTYMLRNQELNIDAETKIYYFYPVIDYTDDMNSHSIVFVDELMRFDELRRIFDGYYRNGTPLSACFITKKGKWTEPIIGMITPYDILEHYSDKETSVDLFEEDEI